MSLIDSPPAQVEVVARLAARTSRCEIIKYASDDDSGDLLEGNCGTMSRSLGWALKGVSVDRINACQVLLTVNAVHSPRLLSLSNCSGRLVESDVGSTWVEQLQRRADIQSRSIEFISYAKVEKRVGCYDVTVTYDARSGAQNTPYKETAAQFCIRRQYDCSKMRGSYSRVCQVV